MIYFHFVVLCNIIIIMVFSLFLLLYLLETVGWGSVSLCIPMWSFVWFLSGFWLSGSVWCLHVQNLRFSLLLHFILSLLVLFVLVLPHLLSCLTVLFSLARIRFKMRATFRKTEITVKAFAHFCIGLQSHNHHTCAV